MLYVMLNNLCTMMYSFCSGEKTFYAKGRTVGRDRCRKGSVSSEIK